MIGPAAKPEAVAPSAECLRDERASGLRGDFGGPDNDPLPLDPTWRQRLARPPAQACPGAPPVWLIGGTHRKAIGTRAPILVEAKPNARWSLDFVNDQLDNGRRFRVLNIVDDVMRECLASMPDTSIARVRVVRELTALAARRGKPETIFPTIAPS